MPEVSDWTQEDTNTEGTGDLALIEKTGWARISGHFSTDDRVQYSISNGDNKEVGRGTLKAGNTFERTEIYFTLDNGVVDVSSPAALTLVGSSTIGVENPATNVSDPVVDNLTVNSAGILILPVGGVVPGAPNLAFGDGNTGFYEQSDNILVLTAAGIKQVQWSNGLYRGKANNQFSIDVITALSYTIPQYSWIADTNSGLTHGGADQASLGVGGIEAVRHTEVSSHVIRTDEMHTGITASTTQSQGQQPLLSSLNEISTVANDGDTVTLPTPAAGTPCEIRNNGDNTLQIFPASGHDLGSGTDIPTELETNETVIFRGFSVTQWYVEAETEIFHAEVFDEDNTDPYVINDAGGDLHAFHSAGLEAGDIVGFTLDLGGAGTSHAIASITDGADSGVDIAVTTGDDHLLEVNDVISQTNLANAAYVGFFVVKAIISSTVYEVAAVFTATGTGTMDQAATIMVAGIATGQYMFQYTNSATSTTNNETFDYAMYHAHISDKTTEVIHGSKTRRKYGTGGDFGATAGMGIHFMDTNDKMFFSLSNQDTAGNITIRHITFILSRL